MPRQPLQRRIAARVVASRLARRALKAKLFDRSYYERQHGSSFPNDLAAARHYFQHGERAGRAPNRLFEPAWYRRRAGAGNGLAHFLGPAGLAGSVGPQFDTDSGGPLGHYLEHADDSSPTYPGDGVEATTWGRLRACLDERATEYATQAALAKSPGYREPSINWDEARNKPRVAGRTSILMPTFRDWRMTERAVSAVFANSTGDVEVVVIDNGSPRSVTSILSARFLAEPRVRIIRVPVNTNFAGGSNLALVESTGETVVFLNNDTQVRPGWLPPLIEALSEPGVLAAQPLLVYPDETVQSAGTVFSGESSIPVHLLAGHPVEDVHGVEETRFDAITAAAMAMRAAVAIAAHGFDPAYVNGMEDVDLCLRLREQPGGHFVVRPASVVVHHESKTPGRGRNIEPNRLLFLSRWEGRLPGAQVQPWQRAGFDVTGFDEGKPLPVSGRHTMRTPILARPGQRVEFGPAAGLPRLRWALKTSAPGGEGGARWGDVAFAQDLAAGLRHWGQEVVIDRRPAHRRSSSERFDDVTVSLRGLAPAVTIPDATNIVWVISHPDDVELDELAAFDLRYAASPKWADDHGARPLLQATNPDRFRPDGPRMAGLDVVFVGRTRQVNRPIVRDAIAAGADLAVFGNGWDAFIDPRFIRSNHLPNDEVPAAYRGARIVLNDHWSDMAQHGFLSNRLFDATACGARVISDPAPGLTDIFGSTIQTYSTVDELKALIADPGPTEDERLKLAERIAAEHSFIARAHTLLSDVLTLRG
ncbi:MAG: glycosyltransferase [Aeromicrobium sp.]